MAMNVQSGPTKGVVPVMNVTPLVDVVLVLLIIFMVVAPRMDQDVQVELPGIFNPDPEVKIAEPIKISVAQAGEYHLGDQVYNLETLTAQLAAEHESDPMRRLVLRGDSRLKYGEVRALLAKTQEIGFPGMSFMVGERHRAAEPAAPAPPAESSGAPPAGAPEPEAAPPPAQSGAGA